MASQVLGTLESRARRNCRMWSSGGAREVGAYHGVLDDVDDGVPHDGALGKVERYHSGQEGDALEALV